MHKTGDENSRSKFFVCLLFFYFYTNIFNSQNRFKMNKLILLLITISAFTLSSVGQQNYVLAQKKFLIHTSFGDMKGILYNETPKHRDRYSL